MITYLCDHCTQKLEFEDYQAGSFVQCPSCGRIATLPHPPSETSPPEGTAIHGSGDSPRAMPSEQWDNPVPTRRQTADQVAAKTPAGDDVSFAGRGPSFLAGLVVALACCVVAALIFGNLTTKCFVPLIALAMLNGYRVGASKMSAGILGLLVGTLVALPAGKLCEGLFGLALGTGGLTNRIISMGIVGVSTAIFVSVILDLAFSRVLRHRPALSQFNRWIGSGLGMLLGSFLGLLLLWGVLVLEPAAAARVALDANPQRVAEPDPTSQRVVALARVIRDSVVGQFAEKVNPLRNVRVFALTNKYLVVLNDPVALTAFTDHPAIERMKERPVVQEVLKTLSEDPDVRRILDSEEEFTGKDLVTILSSPTVLRVLDETDLVAELSPIIDDVQQALDQALEKAGGKLPAQEPVR